MPSYLVGGLVLETDLHLPELPAAAAASPEDQRWLVSVDPGAAAPGLPELHRLVGHDGSLWAVLAGDGARYELRFPGLADFVIDVAARTVRFAHRDGVDEATLRHLLLDQVVPHLLAVDGSLVLHASAVAIESRAVALVGPSGSGKSSLAAALVRAGGTLLGDDFLLVHERSGGYDAVPAYAGLRLWADTAAEFADLAGTTPEPVAQYTEKLRWTPSDAVLTQAPVPLAALVVLGTPNPGGPPCRIGPLGGKDAFIVLFQQAFRMERSGRDRQEQELDRYTRLAATVPVLLLEHQRRYPVLSEVAEALADRIRHLDD